MKEGGNLCSLNSIQDTQNYLTAGAYKTFDPNENSILGTPHGAQPVREFGNEAELSHHEFHSIREDPNPLHQNFLTQIDEEPLGATPISQSQLLITQQPKRQSNSSDKSFRSMLSNCVMERESLKSSKRHSYDLPNYSSKVRSQGISKQASVESFPYLHDPNQQPSFHPKSPLTATLLKKSSLGS